MPLTNKEVVIACGGMVESPLEINPLIPAVAVAVQEKLAPATFEVRIIVAELSPEQTDCVIGLFVTTGRG